MPPIERQPGSGSDVEPMQQPFDSTARFIHMVHFLGQEPLFEDEHRRRERPGCILHPVGQGPV